jgi:predicted lysophospholipase L1 biosynthesis ABC-type transport system permease subunit
VPPLRVLRRDMLPIPSSTWMVYGAALLALGLIMWRLSLDLLLTFALLGGGVIAALVLGGLLLLLNSLRRCSPVRRCRGASVWASCCVIRWRPPARPWRSA